MNAILTIGGGHRSEGPEIAITVRFRGSCAAALINEALARRTKPTELIADTLEVVCRDQLFTAILDDKPEVA